MRVLITGADGFVGKNLVQHLSERSDIVMDRFTKADDPAALAGLVADADFIFHLAGVNRPHDALEFETGNAGLTADIAKAVRQSGRQVPIVFTSSIQARADNPYGASKRNAEGVLENLGREIGASIYIFRLPNIFGKWAKPNYNSAVATFCHNVARDLPINVHDPRASLKLVYIDDLIKQFIVLLDGGDVGLDEEGFATVSPIYDTTVGRVADYIREFRDSRSSLLSARVGIGLERALYATYVSYLPTDRFSYAVPMHADPRGTFVEMLKTRDSGQFSFFTAHPGVTRGGHYHHSKTEKFLVIKGKALFRFVHMVTGEAYQLETSGETAEIVETVPGWTHDITNVGNDEMVVMLWANEIFDRQQPDTFAAVIGDL